MSEPPLPFSPTPPPAPPTPPATPRTTTQVAVAGMDNTRAPNTQGRQPRKRLPEWMQDLPMLRFKPDAPNERAPLINPAELDELLADMDPAVTARIKGDIDFLEYELLRLFRQRDYNAKRQQNRYRKIQLGYVLLAAIATLLGSLQALALAGKPEWMPLLALGETFIALLATFLATISGRESPMPLWLRDRRRAEELRREYFRYMLHLPPYDGVDGYRRSMLLSRRAADINRGDFPEIPTT